MSKRMVRILLWALVLGLMTLIFLFSSQGAEDTMATSGRFAVPIAQWITATWTQLDYEQVLEAVQVVVRKTAHFSEYLALGCAIRWLTMSYALRRTLIWGWLGATLYACTDELHQLLSGQRSGMWQDVVLDSAGAFAGALIAGAAVYLWHRRRRKRTV